MKAAKAANAAHVAIAGLLRIVFCCALVLACHVASADAGHRVLQVDYLVEDGTPLSLPEVTALPEKAWKRRPWSSASYGFATAPH